MPKIRRRNVPPAVLNHLLDRIRLREISADQLGALAEWLDTEPEVPVSSWFKRFRGNDSLWRGRTHQDLPNREASSYRRTGFLINLP